MTMALIRIIALEMTTDFSSSLLSRLKLESHASVLSTTQRFGSTLK
jgi:hypothetical protein